MARLSTLDNVGKSDQPTSMRMSDLMALSPVDFNAGDEPSFGSDGLVEIDAGTKAAMVRKGPIGIAESFKRTDKTEGTIPFNPEAAVKSVKLMNAVDRLRVDNYESDPTQKDKDIQRFNDYIFSAEEERIRGVSIGGRIVQGVLQLPSFMGEFIATGGAATAGKKAVTKTAQTLAANLVKKKAFNFATRVAASTGGAVVRTSLMPQRVVDKFSDLQTNAGLVFTDTGIKIAEEIREKPMTSFFKAFGDVGIENLSEVAGPAIGAGFSKIGKKIIPKKVAEVLAAAFKKLHPGEAVEKLFTKAGYNGFLEELGEERLGDILRAVTGVEDFGAEDPHNMFDRLVSSIPDGEQMLVEAGVLSFPGIARVSASKTAEILRARRQAETKAGNPAPAKVFDEAKVDSFSGKDITDLINKITEEKTGQVSEDDSSDIETQGPLQVQETSKLRKQVLEQLQIEEIDISHGSQENFRKNVEEVSAKIQEVYQNDVLQKGEKVSKVAKLLRENGYVDVNGQPVKDSADVASLMSVYRNPKIEQFHVVFTKGGKVISHRMMTSGSPNAVDLESNIEEIKKKFKKFKPDGIWFSHNHPSGDPTPSQEDIGVTRTLAEEFKGAFKGHVVLNGDTFNHINVGKDGLVSITPDKYSPAIQYDTSGGIKADTPSGAANLAKDYIRKGKLSVMFLDVKLNLAGVESIGAEKNIKEAIKNRISNYGAVQYIISGTPTEVGEFLGREGRNLTSFPAGLADVIGVDLTGKNKSFSAFESKDVAFPQGSTPVKSGFFLREESERFGIEDKNNELIKQIADAEKIEMAKQNRKTIQKRKTTLAKEKLANIEKGIRQGAKLTQAEVKKVQTELIRILDGSELDAKDKAKFQKFIKNTQTEDQFFENIRDLDRRISDLQNKADIREVKKEIKDLLGTTKTKSQGGKPVGKFGAEAQAVFDRARDVVKMTKDEADAAINTILHSLGDEIPTAAQAIEMRLLSMMSGLDNKNPKELQNILKELKSLKEGASVGIIAKNLLRLQKLDQDIETVTETVQGDKPADFRRTNTTIKDFWKSIRSFTEVVQSGWDDLMDFFSQDDSSSKAGKSKLSEIVKVSDIETAEKKGVRISAEKIVDMAKETFGVENEKQLWRRLMADETVQNLGQFRNARGEAVTLEISRAEARKLWMEMQDPTLFDTLFSDRGNAYTPPMVKAIGDLLTQEDIVFAQAQMQFYQDYYKRINDKYKEVYGINLPQNENYSPISREFSKESVADSFLKEIDFRRSVASGSMKSRTDNQRPLILQSDLMVLQKHVTEMEHFIAWVDKIRHLNGIFGDRDVKKIIQDKFGQPAVNVVDGFIQDFTRGRVAQSQQHEKIFNKLRVNFTVSALALKPNITVKQMVSFVAFADHIPTKEFIKGVSDFANPAKVKQIMEVINSSEVMKARGENQTRDIHDAVASKQYAVFKQKQNFQNLLLFTTRLGDRGAIVFGGWSVYRYHRETLGKSHADAMKEFENATSQTQQSGDLSQLSSWQRGGSLAKLYTMFTSSQNQYLRRELSAIRNLAKGRMSKEQFVKKMLIYHFLLPMLFQWVSDLGRWDEKNQLRAAIMGSFNGMFILKDILDIMFRRILGMDTFDNDLAVFQMFEDFGRGIGNTVGSVFEMDMEDVLDSVKELSEDVAGPSLGLPIKQIYRAYEGAADIAEGDVLKGVSKLAGWSPYVVEEAFD